MKELFKRIINIFWKDPEEPKEQKNYFDEEKHAKALKWLKEKWPKDKQICEICNSKSWVLAYDLIMPLQFGDNILVQGGETYPHLLVVCPNCGNSKLFNAVIAGVMEND